MAESLCFLLVEKITLALAEEAINQVGFLFVRERTVLTQVRNRMNQIKSEFEVIQAFLGYIGPRKDNDRLLEAWVKQVREVAFAVEDTIDLYTYLLAERHIRKQGYKIRRPSISTAWNNISEELDGILNRLHHLRDMKERYGIQTIKGDGHNFDEENLKNMADSTLFVSGQERVGRGDKQRLLVKWLLDEELERTVISVSGTAGLGKTTLVSEVYRDPIVKAHFDDRAWVTVSQTQRLDELLRRIAGEFFKEKEETIDMRGSLVSRKLNSYLGQMKYLLVLDDVSSAEVLHELRSILGSGNGSRIVITARNSHVASLASKNRDMELNPLSKEEAWTLFCKKAFWKDRDTVCPPSVESLAKDLVEKCQGVPLAIVSMGNYLSLIEKKEKEWKRVLDDMSWVLNNNPELGMIKSIWTLSFHGLPQHLKNCFLYCGVFPENYPIKRKRLIRLWVAEGFVQERGCRTMEDLAEEYLNDLIRRCMLQVTERNDSGRVKSCKMNSIVRFLALSISEKEDFYAVRGTPAETNLLKGSRRLAVHRSGENMDLFEDKPMLQLRSFVHFDTVCFQMKFKFKLLRVLELQGTPVTSLPKEVFGLFNLYYLGLRKTKIEKISKSIKKLINLQTLDLAYTEIKFLPRSITELKKLRHLFVHTLCDQADNSFMEFSGFPAPENIWDLKQLQTLQGVDAGKKLVKQLKTMTQLRTFRIMKVRAIHCQDLCAAIKKMNQLHRLDILAAEETEKLDMNELDSPPSSLEKLTFRARLEALPTWVGRLNNLTWLRLCWCSLTVDPLPSIAKLPNLVFLLLTKAYDGMELTFKKEWFPKLKDLRLVDMKKLWRLEIEEESMPKLRQLNLVRCPELKEMPLGTWNLKKLEMIYLEEMPEEFVEGLANRKEGSFRRQKSDDQMKNPPNPLVIIHVYKKDGEWHGKSLRDPDLSLYEKEYIQRLRDENDWKEDS